VSGRFAAPFAIASSRTYIGAHRAERPLPSAGESHGEAALLFLRLFLVSGRDERMAMRTPFDTWPVAIARERTIMTHNHSSKTLPSIDRLKEEARLLRRTLAGSGTDIAHSTALEHVAKLHGFRDWNTLAARAGNRPPELVIALGDTVSGTYLGQEILGSVVAIRQKNGSYREVTIHLDTPVDVVTFEGFSNFRSRITATIDPYGVSPSKTGNGQPHLKLD
jgi:hypothetical protein